MVVNAGRFFPGSDSRISRTEQAPLVQSASITRNSRGVSLGFAILTIGEVILTTHIVICQMSIQPRLMKSVFREWLRRNARRKRHQIATHQLQHSCAGRRQTNDLRVAPSPQDFSQDGLGNGHPSAWSPVSEKALSL